MATFCSNCGSGEFSTTDPELDRKRTRLILNNTVLRAGLALLVWMFVVGTALVVASGHGHGLNARTINSAVFAGTLAATFTFVSSRVPAVTRIEVAGLLMQLVIVGGIAAIVASGLAMLLASDR